jgi:O-antigen ligase
MCWIILIVNIVSLVDYFDLPNLGLLAPLKGDRFGGAIGESNQYGAFLSLFLPAFVVLVRIERRVLRQLAIVGLILGVLALLLTESRGALLGIVCGSAVAAVYLRQMISARTIRIGAIATIAILIVSGAGLYAGGYLDSLSERVVVESTRGDAYAISSGRTAIWGRALGKMIEQPISLVTGFGWDSYTTWFSFRFAPHNSYLGLYFELGLFGIFLVFAAFAGLLRSARLAMRHTDGAAALWLTAFIFGFLAFIFSIIFVDLTALWLLVWAYSGILMRLAVCEQRKPVSETPDTIRVNSGKKPVHFARRV